MKLIHFTDADKTLEELVSVKQSNYSSWAYIGKPMGLWVSDEEDYGWSQWCDDNLFRDTSKQLMYEVKLRSNSNVLRINSSEHLRLFSEEYAFSLDADSEESTEYEGYLRIIDWELVSKTYQGIIITPYQWNCRTELMWYYGWDCASGCIWDKNAIESFTWVSRKPKVRRRIG